MDVKVPHADKGVVLMLHGPALSTLADNINSRCAPVRFPLPNAAVVQSAAVRCKGHLAVEVQPAACKG